MDPDPGSHLILLASFGEFFSGHWMFFGIMVLLLMLAALAASTEVAFFSLNRVDIEGIRESNTRSDKLILELLHRPKQLLATLLIFNNLVSVGMVILSTFVFGEMVAYFDWGHEYLTTASGAMEKIEVPWQQILIKVVEVGLITFILMFFGEITPKVYASQNRQWMVRRMVYWLKPASVVLYPFAWMLMNTTRYIDKRFKPGKTDASFEEIKHAIDLTSEEESPDEEKEILKGIVTFSSISVKSIMRSRVDVSAVNFMATFDEVLKQVSEFGYSRLPVYDDTLDNVRGVLYIKDLLPLIREGNFEAKWQALVRPPYFVPESKKIDDLLDEFKSKRLHVAIVVDEFGGTSGIVTLEDIIEEIFGEINDEFDEDDTPYSKLSETEFIFDGKISLNDLVKVTDLPDNIFSEVKREADSLAGLILEICGKFPEKNDVIEFENVKFIIESVSKHRISRIKMLIPEKNETEDFESVNE